MDEAVVLGVLLLAAAAGQWWLLRGLRPVPRGDGHQAGAGVVSVVIPARDEACTLPEALQSLRELEVEVYDVVVVDDDSQDATATIAASAGARVVPAGTPPPGWTGKAWACHVGAHATGGELLLFLDADTVLATDALGGLLRLHDRHGGLVSVQPFHSVVRPYEHLSAYFNAVSLMASDAFSRRPRTRPMAFGPCLLTSRADYGRAGGHAAVSGEILDDVQLAAAYRRAGLPVHVAVGGSSLRMRSYPGGFRQLVDGFTKNFASGAGAAALGPALATVLWVSGHHAVAVGAAVAVVDAATGPGSPSSYAQLGPWAVAWAVVAWQLRWVLTRIGSFARWTWLLFPVPLLVFDVLFARSVALTAVRRSVRWRGREVALSRRGSAEEGV